MNNRIVLILGLALIASGCASTSNPDQQANESDEQVDNLVPSQLNQSSNQTSNDIVFSDSVNSTSESGVEDSSSESDGLGRIGMAIMHSSTGFSKNTVTIEQGETVLWESRSGDMWIASDQHPTHTEYSDTSVAEHCENGDQNTAAFDQCSTGNSFSFTFSKTGEWSYHNHVAPGQTVTVIVE